ncbi:MAG: DMT family transporter [Betaproteobacteria bacterium]
MNPRQLNRFADLLLLLVAATWGSSYAVAKQATLDVPVLQFLALRFGLTFLILLPTLKPLLARAGRRGLAPAGLLGANLLAIYLCETFGVTLTSAANAAFLISLCVALTPWAEWWLLGVRPSASTMAAAGVSALGAALLAASGPLDAAVGRGDALMLAAAVLRAVIVCLTKRFGAANPLPALTLTAVQSGVMALATAALSLLIPGSHWVALPHAPAFWGCMAWLVGACTLFAFVVQNWAIARSSPSRVALVMGSEPLFGALLAMAWLGERMTPLGWLGGLLIVGAALQVTLPTRPRVSPRAA